jgi:hypothetical protein
MVAAGLVAIPLLTEAVFTVVKALRAGAMEATFP